MVKCSNGESGCMSFKILGSGIMYEGGHYKSKSVAKAGRRAGIKLYQKIDNKPEYKKYSSKKSIKFILGETTRGSARTTYAFEIYRMKLDKPKTVKRGDLTYEVKYKYVCKRLNESDREVEELKKDAEAKKAAKKAAKKSS